MNDDRGPRTPIRRKLWRSLAERTPNHEALERRTREFAPGADEPPDPVARRDFLRLVGATAALTGTAACQRAPRDKIRPYVVQPPESVPGVPLLFATTMTLDGYAVGLIAESHEGRPTKLEGNPEHPASFGGTGPLEQASILDLYDPDRATTIARDGSPATWRDFVTTLTSKMARPGAHLVLEATSSPLVAEQVIRLRARFPLLDVRWHAPLAPVARWEGSRLALGAVLEPVVNLEGAQVVLALDSDFLAHGPAWRALARDFANARRLRAATEGMNRLYVTEPSLSVTGMSADERLRVRACDVFAVGARVAAELAALGAPLPKDLLDELAPWSAVPPTQATWARAVARDLTAHRGACIVLVGDDQPAELHALGHAMNAALGNVGKTVHYVPSPIVDAGTDAFDLEPLARALDRDDVETLVVLGGNPAYDAFSDLDLATRFRRAKESAYLGRHVNETARACHWFVPAAHYLETWADARALDGTVSLAQPLALPRADAHTTAEILSAVLGEPAATGHDLLVAHWRRARQDFDGSWDSWLARGFIPGTASATVSVSVRHGAVRDAVAKREPPPDASTLEVCFRRDARVHDGAFANNAWLQEMPDPVTRLTWGNAALLSRVTAARLRVRDGDVLRLQVGDRVVEAPSLVVPGHADDTIALALGYGRGGEGETVAQGVGANAYALRTTASRSFAPGVASRTGARSELALEQLHSSLEGRDDDILLHRTLDEYRAAPSFAEARDRRPLALYDLKADGPRQWGMVIDLTACTGCGSCVIACQAENNVPVVGKAGVAKGRAMHWLRIDRYFIGPPDDPHAVVEPMLCQHCEKAPCEYVCPVGATTHSTDGLNQMIYNRCVGTRFCSNNCPYKVRRFNWFNYHQDEAASVALVHNPDVTVRARGVMEKCTYCVQRIREAEIRSEVQRRPLADGDVVTACEQACPSRAITFGDIANPTSRVSVLRKSDRRFAALNDLGTVPRTRYLARIRNPNPELA